MWTSNFLVYRGLFGDELGHDFFGFKELGLDQEHSMSSLQIPTKLWFKHDESRLEKMAQGKTKGRTPSAHHVALLTLIF